MTLRKRFAFVALLGIVAALAMWTFGNSRNAQADIQAGSYSLEVAAPPISSPSGPSFHAIVGNFWAAPETNFQAVTWNVPYNPAIVSVVSITPIATAAQCPNPSQNDNGSRVLVGCIDLAGDNISFSGNSWDIEFQCIALGPTGIALDAVNDTGILSTSGPRPFHTHDPITTFPPDGTVCASLADLAITKSSPTSPVVAGGNVQYDLDVVNNGPDFASSVVVADDLPDNLGFVSCTQSIDVNGDTVPEFAGPCTSAPVPGSDDVNNSHYPAFPNPFPPPAIVNNVVLTGTDFVLQPGLAVGGTYHVTIIASVPADYSGKPLVDVGLTASTDNFGGIAVTDPSFLTDCNTPPDGNTVDQPGGPGCPAGDNNFSALVQNTAPANVTITKTGPAGGSEGGNGQYTLTVNNAGPSPATNVVVTDDANQLGGSGTTTATITNVTGTGCGFAGNIATCNIATIPSGGSEIITIDVDFTASGVICNTASVSWADPMVSSNEVCFTIIPPFNGLVKSVDGDVPASGQTTIQKNLWICTDQATDGIDNDGDSTVDNEAPTCQGNGQGTLDISELVFSSRDCDTRNDDNDGDGKPVDGSVADGSTSPYIGSNPRPECYQPTLQDYALGLVDKDGGETPEGLGAFEFQLKFDHKVFDITIEDSTAWTNGRTLNCSMTIITENDIRYGCVTTGAAPGLAQVSGLVAATIHVTYDPDIALRVIPTKDNGIVRALLDENCEIADTLGDIFPDTNAGLTQDCTDIDITVRRLEGDINGDCTVGVEDEQLEAFRYGSFFGHLSYDRFYDLEPWPTGDFDIDIKDLQFVFGREGSNCSGPLIPDNQNPLPANGVGQP